MKENYYVLGFIFDHSFTRIALIRKQKPTWQRGLLNAIGGRVEEKDINSNHAMIREFQEKTGFDTNNYVWRMFAKLEGKDFQVDCFALAIDDLWDLKTITDEEIEIYNIDTFFKKNKTVDNLEFLTHLAINKLKRVQANSTDEMFAHIMY